MLFTTSAWPEAAGTCLKRIRQDPPRWSHPCRNAAGPRRSQHSRDVGEPHPQAFVSVGINGFEREVWERGVRVEEDQEGG